MRIRLEDLQELCIKALCLSGMSNEHARIVAEVLSETDGYGTFSHGTVNLHNYIRKMKTGGLDFQAIPKSSEKDLLSRYLMLTTHSA